MLGHLLSLAAFAQHNTGRNPIVYHSSSFIFFAVESVHGVTLLQFIRSSRSFPVCSYYEVLCMSFSR